MSESPVPEVSKPITSLDIALKLTGAQGPARRLHDTPGFDSLLNGLKHPLLLYKYAAFYKQLFDGCLKMKPSAFSSEYTLDSMLKAAALIRKIDDQQEPEATVRLFYAQKKSHCVAGELLEIVKKLELFIFVVKEQNQVFADFEKKFHLAGYERGGHTRLNWLDNENTRLVPERLGDFTKILLALPNALRRERDVPTGLRNGDLLSDLLKSPQLLTILVNVNSFVALLKGAGREGFKDLANSPNLGLALERKKDVALVAQKIGRKAFAVFINSDDLIFMLDNKSQIAAAAEKNSGRDIVRNLAAAEPAQKAEVLAMMAKYQMHLPGPAKKASADRRDTSPPSWSK